MHLHAKTDAASGQPIGVPRIREGSIQNWQTASSVLENLVTDYEDGEALREEPEIGSVEIIDNARVTPYLRLYPNVAKAATDAATRLHVLFNGATLRLSVERLPSDDWQPKLVLRVVVAEPIGEAVEKLDSFNIAWWADRPESIENNLRIRLA